MANVLEFFANTRERLQGHGVGAVFARGASGSFGVMALGAVMTLCTNMLLTRVMGVAQWSASRRPPMFRRASGLPPQAD